MVDVRLPQVLKVEVLGELDNARGGADVEGAGALPLGLQGVPDLAVGKGLGLDGDYVGVFLLALWDLSL